MRNGIKRVSTAILLLLLIIPPMSAQAPMSAQGLGNRRELIWAEYGWGNSWVNVTDRVGSLIRGSSLTFRVDDNTLGFASGPGRNNVLRIYLRNRQGRTQMVSFREDTWVRLRRIVSPYPAGDSYGRDLRILFATYGYGNRSLDVTNRLRRQISNDQINLRVTNQTMGGDPAVGADKVLTVFFAANGRRERVAVPEGGYLRLSASGMAYEPGDPFSGDLQILRATYGSFNRRIDVTSRLQNQIYNDRIDLRVTNENMGGDPAVGADKTLNVLFIANGRRDELVVREGDTLRLSGSGVNYGGGDPNVRDLQILRAIYGYGSQSIDVTSRLQNRIYNNEINLQVTNETMGGDPAVGVEKSLTVQFSANGRRDQVVVREGDTLRLSGRVVSYDDGDPYSRNLQILRGTYGYGNRVFDVTSRLQGQIYNDRIELRVTNENMGGDPAQGVEKTLQVDYAFNGRRDQVVVREGDTLRLPQNDIGYLGGYTIIPRGTEMKIRTNESIDSRTASAGQRFSAVMEEDVRDSNGNVLVARHSDADLVIRSTAGNDLVLDIESLTVAGNRYYVSTEDVERDGRSGLGANKRTAVLVGGGAVAGAIIGSILGGGKGAAIGAGVGAGAGAIGQILTGGREVRVPPETVLTFRLDQDLRLNTSTY